MVICLVQTNGSTHFYRNGYVDGLADKEKNGIESRDY